MVGRGYIHQCSGHAAAAPDSHDVPHWQRRSVNVVSSEKLAGADTAELSAPVTTLSLPGPRLYRLCRSGGVSARGGPCIEPVMYRHRTRHVSNLQSGTPTCSHAPLKHRPCARGGGGEVRRQRETVG